MDKRIEELHNRLLKLFVDGGVIGRHIKKYIKPDFYPVLIGGINVVRCAALEPGARALIGSLYSNDIDIKFVIMKPVQDHEDAAVVAAHEARMAFVADIMNDNKMVASVRRVVDKMNAGHGDKIEVHMSLEDFRTKEHEGVKRNMMVNIKAEYIVNGKKVGSHAIIDTGIFSTYSQEDFVSYQKFFQNELRRPIPFYVYKGIPFATCGWAYYDTVRMLVLYGQRYEEANTPKEKRWQFNKVLKYVVKFSVLFTQINRLRNDANYEKITRVYKRSKELLKKIKFASDPVVTRRQKRVLEELLEELDRETSLARLIKILMNRETPISGFK